MSFIICQLQFQNHAAENLDRQARLKKKQRRKHFLSRWSFWSTGTSFQSTVIRKSAKNKADNSTSEITQPNCSPRSRLLKLLKSSRSRGRRKESLLGGSNENENENWVVSSRQRSHVVKNFLRKEIRKCDVTSFTAGTVMTRRSLVIERDEDFATVLPSKEVSDDHQRPWPDFLEAKQNYFDELRQKIRFNFDILHKDSWGEERFTKAFAGCSMLHIKDKSLASFDSLEFVNREELSKISETSKDSQFFSYSDPRIRKVRKGPNYRKHREKRESGLALYDLVSLDSFDSASKIYNFGELVDFSQAVESSLEGDEFGLPEFLIVNVMIPVYKPMNPLFHERRKNGKGVNVVHIFKLSDFAKRNASDSSVCLFREFIQACVRYKKTGAIHEREMINRLKNIITLLNVSQLGLSRIEQRLHRRFNSTPWLIRYFLTNYTLREIEGINGKKSNYFEIDIDYHNFRYTTLQLGHLVFSKVEHAILDSALLIEARKDEEMPERILCNVRIFHLSLQNSPTISFTKDKMSLKTENRDGLNKTEENIGQIGEKGLPNERETSLESRDAVERIRKSFEEVCSQEEKSPKLVVLGFSPKAGLVVLLTIVSSVVYIVLG